MFVKCAPGDTRGHNIGSQGLGLVSGNIPSSAPEGCKETLQSYLHTPNDWLIKLISAGLFLIYNNVISLISEYSLLTQLLLVKLLIWIIWCVTKLFLEVFVEYRDIFILVIDIILF